MADRSTKSQNQNETLCGIIIRSSIDSGSILGITPPKADKRFFILGPKDIPGSNTVAVFDDDFPLFASTDISYRGQPIIALFGPDTETVEVKSREVEIDFQLTADAGPYHTKHVHSPIVYRWGNLHEILSQSATTFERTYVDRRVWTREDTVTQVRTWIDGDLLRVEAPTQWPFHVRDTVATVCGRTRKSVVVHPKGHFSPKDEKLILPSVLAAVSALATMKSGKQVRMISRFPTYKSPITISRRTALDAQGKPIAEAVEAIVDQGAFPLFTAELFKQILTGLIPMYELQAFSATVKIAESHSPPSHFFGDLGYSSALFSTEAHASALARSREANPSNWRMKHYADGKKRSEVLETLPIAKLRDLMGETCTVSDFARHHSVYELQRKTRNPISAFLNYSRGIGISCGAGVSGFSSESPLHTAAKLSVTLDTNNRVIVNSSFFTSRKTTTLWRSVIAKELSIERENVSFVEPDTMHMADTGPEVLSLDVERSVIMLMQCCNAIKAKRFQEPLPITESITAKSALPASPPAMFSSRNWGCLIVELEVNTISFDVEIRRVWGRFTFSNTTDIRRLQMKFRHIINTSLRECNVTPIHRDGIPPLMDIQVNTLESEAYPSSATSALRAMVMAACTSALSQALNCDATKMPITSEDIISYIRREE